MNSQARGRGHVHQGCDEAVHVLAALVHHHVRVHHEHLHFFLLQGGFMRGS